MELEYRKTGDKNAKNREIEFQTRELKKMILEHSKLEKSFYQEKMDNNR